MSDKKTFADFLPKSFKEQFLKYKKEYFDTLPPATPAAPAAPAPAPQQGTLQDGTIIKWDTPTLGVGSTITVVNPDGSGELPAPDGELVMQDGTNLTIVGGKVTEIESAATEKTEPQDPAQMAAPAGVPGDPNAPANGQDENPNTEKRLQALEAAVKSMQAMMGGMPTQAQNSAQFKTQTSRIEVQDKTIKQLFELMGNMLDVPSADPVETPQSTVKLSKQEKALEKFINRKTTK